MSKRGILSILMVLVVVFTSFMCFIPEEVFAAAEGPYGGIAPNIPGADGIVQAENFDTGGAGVAYYADTPNNDGNDPNYRTDAPDADISTSGTVRYLSASNTKNYFPTYGTVTVGNIDPNTGKELNSGDAGYDPNWTRCMPIGLDPNMTYVFSSKEDPNLTGKTIKIFKYKQDATGSGDRPFNFDSYTTLGSNQIYTVPASDGDPNFCVSYEFEVNNPNTNINYQIARNDPNAKVYKPGLTKGLDWYKYTINVTNSNWYTISINARFRTQAGLKSIIMEMDRRYYGESNGESYSTTFSNQQLSFDNGLIDRIYLTQGTHIMTLGLYAGAGGNPFDIDYFKFAATTVPVIPSSPKPTPRVVTSAEAPNTKDEVVVADVVMTPGDVFGYPADPGAADCSTAIQKALNYVGTLGGGTVFLPATSFIDLENPITIPKNVTLRGDWLPPTDTNTLRGSQGTLIMANTPPCASDALSIDPNTAPLISMSQNSAIKNLSIWYSSQDPNTPIPYPYTIACTKDNFSFATISKVTLYNSYNGIFIGNDGKKKGGWIQRGWDNQINCLYATCLKRGLVRGDNGEAGSTVTNVTIDPNIWEIMPPEIFSNVPTTTAQKTALENYTKTNLVAWQESYNIGPVYYNVTINKANKYLWTSCLPHEDGDPWGGIMQQMSCDNPNWFVQDFPNPVMNYANMDNIYSAYALTPVQYDMSYMVSNGYKYPISNWTDPNLPVSKDLILTSAKGDGYSDDTNAIQDALNSAGADPNGATVYLPAGEYRITRPLQIPYNVELRGSFGGKHGCESLDGCVLLIDDSNTYTDTQANDPNNAFIKLGGHSGIRGFQIVYANNPCSKSTPPKILPYTILGDDDIWVKDVSILNAYNLINLKSKKCNGHLISDVVATAFHNGIVVGGGSSGGAIEKCTINDNHLEFAGNRPSVQYDHNTALSKSVSSSLPFIFGDSTDERTFAITTYEPHVGVKFVNDGTGGCKNAIFFAPTIDCGDTNQANYLFEGGNFTSSTPITILGMYGNNVPSLMKSLSTFNGYVNVYGDLTYDFKNNKWWPQTVEENLANPGLFNIIARHQ